MKKLLRFGVFTAAMCCACFFSGNRSHAAEQAAEKPAPKVHSITKENIHGIVAPDDQNIWLLCSYGVIYHSSDAGATWTLQKSGVETLLVEGSFLNAKVGWVVGISGTVLHTTDGGKTWTRQNAETDKHLFSVSFINEKKGWAVGSEGAIIATQDGGKTWAAQGEPADRAYNSVLFVDENNGLIVGETGTMLRTADGGATWTAIVPPIFERASLEEEIERPRQSLYDLAAVDRDNIVACGLDSLFLRTSDGGATWESFKADKVLGVYGLCMKGDRGWAVGDRGALFTSGDAGRTWKLQENVIKTGNWLSDVAFITPEKGWAVGAYDTIVATTNGGTTWDFKAGIFYTVTDFPVPRYVTKQLEFRKLAYE